MNFADILQRHALGRPDHPAIEDGARLIRYGELAGLARQRAANLHQAGIHHGDIVAVILPDGADHLITLFALARLGAVIFSLAPYILRQDIEKSLASVRTRAVIAPRALISSNVDREVSGGGRGPFGRDLLNLPAEEICRPGDGTYVAPSIGGDEALMLNQSSGTTGAPKTFLRSHTEMVQWVQRYSHAQNWSPNDRCLSLNHMAFNIGRCVCLGMLHMGATIIVNRANTLDALVAFIREKRISYVKLTPSHLRTLLKYGDGGTPLFPDVRAMVVGSAPTTPAERLLARRTLTPNLYEQLGTNEAGLLVMASPADQDARPDALGRVVEGVEVQIVGADGTLLAAGEVGQVRYRGAGIITHYLDNPEADARTFRDGWFYPGDLAAIDAEGYLYFKGRADDVINNEGAKFYPIEVEAALLAHPDVAEAAVLGWPHQRHGEIAVAFVVRKLQSLGERELRAHCRARIAGYKLPGMILFLPDLPKNPMGKIVKNRLREHLNRQLKKRAPGTRKRRGEDGEKSK